jgi:Rieske Fe-S protein
MMDRKAFLKNSCTFCLCGMAAALPSLTGCSPAGYAVFKTVPVNNMVEIPLAFFEKANMQFVRPKDWLYDIAVHKKEDGSFSAILMQCTHMANQLTPSQSGFTCSLHGSRFNGEGQVIKGPAEKSLKTFATTVSHNSLLIKI